MTSHRKIQERTEWRNQEKVGRGRKSPQHNRRMAGKSGQTRQEPEAE